MKLTGKILCKKSYMGVSEIGLIVFAYSDLKPKQKQLKSYLCNTFLVLRKQGWDIEQRRDKEYLKEIILDNFSNFDFFNKFFWFYLESELETSEYLFVKQLSKFMINE